MRRCRHRILAPVALGLLLWSARATGADDWRERARAAWSGYLSELANVEGTVRLRMYDTDESFQPVTLTAAQDERLTWSGKSIRNEIQILPPQGDHLIVKLQNDDYGALARRPSASREFALRRLTLSSGGEIDGRLLDHVQPLSDVLMSLAIGLTAHPDWVPDLLLGPETTIDAVESGDRDGERILRIRFHCRPDKVEAYVERGQIELLEDHYLLLRKAELRKVVPSAKPVLIYSGAWDVTYRTDAATQLPLPVRHVQTGAHEYLGAKGPHLFNLITRECDLSLTSQIDPRDFRLASLGLPEPVPAGAERQRWWLVLLASGVAMLAVWWILNRRRREN